MPRSWEPGEHARIFQIMDDIYLLAKHKDWARLDQYLLQCDLTERDTSLVAYIRTTYAMKSMLPSWELTRDRIRDEFNRRGEDGKAIMQGLY